MDDAPIHLNIGCGISYKPGSINIDMIGNKVADSTAKADNLPFPPGSVGLIEAYHLIEHFDLVHAKFVLSHWYRTLRKGGTLVIETPDLGKAFSEFRKSESKRKRSLLQWVYGIDSPGMKHGTGFDFVLLEKVLRECGFVNIRREEQYTHRYEDGIRVICRKRESRGIAFEFISALREKIMKKLHGTEDSLEMIPLEEHVMKRIIEKLGIYKQLNSKIIRKGTKSIDKKISKLGKSLADKSANRNSVLPSSSPQLKNGDDISNSLISLISTASVCNPILARILLVTASSDEFRTLFPESSHNKLLKRITELIRYLSGIRFHCRLFNLWKKAKKTKGSSHQDFEEFILNQETHLGKLLCDRNMNENYFNRIFSYIKRQEPAKNILFFHFHAIRYQARISLNKGIKAFHLGNHSDALKNFRNSSALYPDEPLVKWNLARLAAYKGMDSENVISFYKLGIRLSTLQGLEPMSERIKKEALEFTKKGAAGVPGKPVSEFTIFEKHW